jgi:hypothetical protein
MRSPRATSRAARRTAVRATCDHHRGGNDPYRATIPDLDAGLHPASKFIVFRRSLTSLIPEPRAGARASGLRSVSTGGQQGMQRMPSTLDLADRIELVVRASGY